MEQVPPGWYPEPGNPAAVRWWDGSTWTGNRRAVGHAGGYPSRARPALGSGWPSLALALQAVLGLTAVVALGLAGLSGYERVLLRRWLDDPRTVDAPLADRVDLVYLLSALALLALLLICGVLFIAWLYQAHRSDRMDPTCLRHDSGWAIGGWFVPILAWWRPLQMVRDVERGATRGRGRSWVPAAWWSGWAVGHLTWVLSRATTPNETRTDVGLEDFLASATVNVFAYLAWAVSALLALVLVRYLTSTVLRSGQVA